MRQIAPISSALHLGAERVLVVGVAHHQISEEGEIRKKSLNYPSLAEIAGHALDSIFLDSMEVDLERLQRINRTVQLIPEDMRSDVKLRHIEVLIIAPSQSLETIAERYIDQLPWPIRILLRAVGVLRGSGAKLVSYLLFERQYCRALIDLGYQDALQRRDEIVKFLATVPVAESDASPQ